MSARIAELQLSGDPPPAIGGIDTGDRVPRLVAGAADGREPYETNLMFGEDMAAWIEPGAARDDPEPRLVGRKASRGRGVVEAGGR